MAAFLIYVSDFMGKYEQIVNNPYRIGFLSFLWFLIFRKFDELHKSGEKVGDNSSLKVYGNLPDSLNDAEAIVPDKIIVEKQFKNENQGKEPALL